MDFIDFNNSLTFVILIVGAIAIVTVLVIIFYKPGKKLKVDAAYLVESGSSDKFIEFHIVNVGKKRVKLGIPFVRFYSGRQSLLFEIKKSYTSCKFPKILEVGQEMRCKFEVAHFYEVLDNKNFHPHHVKIVIRETIGMRFRSNTLEYKH